MSLEKILFYLFALILTGAALRVITCRNPVHAALWLVLCFFTSSALWLLIEAEFLAIVLVLVYVGAVMVLFLFVVMMLDIRLAVLREGFARYLPAGLIVGGLILLEMVLVLGPKYFGLELFGAPRPKPAAYSNTEALGQVLYTVHVYAFEIAAAILLVAIVAAISLTLRQREGLKAIDPAAQVAVRREDRIRLVNLPSAGKPGAAGEGA
jgi:NADH-quinone oxidoreductase subunit J